MTTILLSLLALIVVGVIIAAKRAAKNMPENLGWINMGKKVGAEVGTAEDGEAALPPALQALSYPYDPFHVLKFERALNFNPNGTSFVVSVKDFIFNDGPEHADNIMTRWKFYFAKFTLTKPVPRSVVMSLSLSTVPDNSITRGLGNMVNTELEGEFGIKRKVYVNPGEEAEVREWLQPDLMSVILEHPGISIELSGNYGFCFSGASTILKEEELTKFLNGTQAIIKELMD